jgi:serine/threonine protein phosphatase PrpC
MMLELPRFHFGVQFAGASHVGRVRQNNEDAWRVDMDLGLFTIADGMGGHAAGEVAAMLGLDTLLNALKAPQVIQCLDAYVSGPTLDARRSVVAAVRWAAQQAHSRILAEAEANKARRGMGCTLEAALLLGDSAFLVHVGDSRVYLARPSATIQLTHDHTIEGWRLLSGLRTPSERPSGRDALTSAMGLKDGPRIDDVFVELAQGDRIVLCTDGVHGQIESEATIARLSKTGAPQEAVHALIGAALDGGGKDNATVLIVDVGGRRRANAAFDGGVKARDLTLASHSYLLQGLPTVACSRVLSAGVETEFKPGAKLPRFFADDRVAYVVLEGEVNTPEGWVLGPSAILYPESLAGAGRGTQFCSALQPIRTLRIRSDDFREVCSSDVALAAALYERLARMLAQRF